MIRIILTLIALVYFFRQGICQDDEIFDPYTGHTEPNKLDLNENEEISKLIPLTGFEPGEYIHQRAGDYCQGVYEQIESIGREGQKINRIRIVGFADGLSNHRMIPRSQIIPDCQMVSGFRGGEEDLQLASLRACNVESILRDLLTSRSIANVLSVERIDIPDGGYSGPEFRKVEVHIYHYSQ